jgi:hypothetical protein
LDVINSSQCKLKSNTQFLSRIWCNWLFNPWEEWQSSLFHCFCNRTRSW